MFKFVFLLFLTGSILTASPLSGANSADTPDPREKNAKSTMTYRMVPLLGVRYSTVDKTCRSWLSPGGVLTHEESRESVLVYDTPEIIGKIESFIRDIKPETYNIRVTVDYVGMSVQEKTKVGVVGKNGRRRIMIPNRRTQPSGAINFNQNRGTTSSNQSMVLTVANGLPASLWIGKTQVDPSWLDAQVFVPDLIIATPGNVIRIPGTNLRDIKWADVGASLMIRPTYNDATGNVTLELYPRISYLEGGKRKALRVETLTTTIVVKVGQRVQVGGLMGAKKEEMLNLLGHDFFTNKQNVSVTDIYVRCEALKPGDRRNSNLRTLSL